MPSPPDPHVPWSAFLALFAGYSFFPSDARAPDTGAVLGSVKGASICMGSDSVLGTVKWAAVKDEPVSLATCLMSEDTYRTLRSATDSAGSVFYVQGVAYRLRFLCWGTVMEARAVPHV